jgi:hypothetical protein
MAVEAIDHASSPPVAALILPSLNDMFDIVTTRKSTGEPRRIEFNYEHGILDRGQRIRQA